MCIRTIKFWSLAKFSYNECIHLSFVLTNDKIKWCMGNMLEGKRKNSLFSLFSNSTVQ